MRKTRDDVFRGLRWASISFLFVMIVGCGNPGPPGPPPGISIGGGGGGFNPVGLFFNRFTGPVSGTEFLQVMTSSSTGRFLFTTLDGSGVEASVDRVGMIGVVNVATGSGSATGTGVFSNANNFTLAPTLTVPGIFTDAVFSYTGNRLIGTGTDFPVEASTISGSSVVDGMYRATIILGDPETGTATGTQSIEDVSLAVSGTVLTVTRPTGAFYRGVFVSPTRVAFREVSTGTGRWASFAGSESNTGQDMVGLLDFDSNGFAATIAFQTRAARGSQTQSFLAISADTIANQNGNVGIVIQNQSAFGVFIRAFVSSDSAASASQIMATGQELVVLGGSPLASFGANATAVVNCVSAASIVVTADFFEFPTGGFSAGVSDVFRQGTDFNCNNQIVFTVDAVNATELIITGFAQP